MLGFCLCDATTEFFGLAAKVHPQQLVQLRQQPIDFPLTLFKLCLQGMVQRLLFGKKAF